MVFDKVMSFILDDDFLMTSFFTNTALQSQKAVSAYL